MENMIGKTPIEICQIGTDVLVFKFSDETSCKFYHEQDCCESVDIEDVNGNWPDLYGSPLLVAEERTNSNNTEYGSETYTFYCFRGIGGSVDVRWHGESNGWYSESVDFAWIAA